MFWEIVASLLVVAISKLYIQCFDFVQSAGKCLLLEFSLSVHFISVEV